MYIIYSTKKAIGAGAIGGIVGGIVMLAPMMAMMSMLNLPSDLFPKLVGMTLGQTPESAAMVGIGFHFIASIIIGLIFGAVINASALMISSFKKGIGLGLATGIISFVVLFLPMMMVIFPPTMMKMMAMMNPNAPQDMIMKQLQGMQPMLLAGSAISHLIYGAVLGAVVSAILTRKVTCPRCKAQMTKKEFESHKGACKVS